MSGKCKLAAGISERMASAAYVDVTKEATVFTVSGENGNSDLTCILQLLIKNDMSFRDTEL